MMHFLWHKKHFTEQKNCRSLLYGRTGLSSMVIRECASYAGWQPLVFIISLKDFSDLGKRTDWEKMKHVGENETIISKAGSVQIAEMHMETPRLASSGTVR